jgi:hypothetical protein
MMQQIVAPFRLWPPCIYIHIYIYVCVCVCILW